MATDNNDKNNVDPELGEEEQKQVMATPAPSTSPGPAWLNKKNILIGGACGLAIIVLGVAIGVPVSNANKRAAETQAGANQVSPAIPGPQTQESSTSSTAKIFVPKAQTMPFRFQEQLQPFSRNVMAGYDSCGDLLQDVQHALESLANQQIERGRDMTCWWDPNGPYVYEEDETSEEYPCYMMDSSSENSDRHTAPTASPPSSEDSFGTNNQVEGVDEADIIKSNGEFVFMGYGRDVIVIDLNGMILDRVEVPLPPNATQLQPGFGQEENGNGMVDNNIVSDVSLVSSRTQNRGWGCGRPPQPQYRKIRSLLMHENEAEASITLNVITTFDDWKCNSSLCGGLTTAFIYKFDAAANGTKKLSLVASQDVNGAYDNARGIGSTNHIVTNARIDTWDFTGPLYRCDQSFWNMTYGEYQEAALQKANETVAQNAQDIVNGLSWVNTDANSTDASCKHVVQISSMTSGDQDLTAQEKRSLNLFRNQGVLRNFVQITSLDLEEVIPAPDNSTVARNETLGTGLGSVKSAAAGAFMAQYNPELYATASDLILAGRGWRYDTKGRWDEYTFLMSFDLASQGSGAGFKAAVPKAIGEVTGYLKNQFSMDVFEDHLRVATTSFQKWERLLNLHTNITSWVVATNSTSQVTVLKDTENGVLEQVGFVGELGPSEDIKSVRFIGDRGYVVTFRTVDPLYSLDLSAPSDPRVMGELKITGFSEYMHPISGGDGVSQVGDYLLTVGKEADETDGGRITGTKIAVFDVRDITNPLMVDDFVISNEESGWSGSAATRDHHAFRYLEESKKLIIPLYQYDWNNQMNNFDGFVVYNIDIANKEISVTGTVTHSKEEETFRYCWGQASLPSRSMVFAGNLMTFKSHSIKMTTDVNNLVGDTWDFGQVNLDENRTQSDMDGCYGYWPWMRF